MSTLNKVLSFWSKFAESKWEWMRVVVSCSNCKNVFNFQFSWKIHKFSVKKFHTKWEYNTSYPITQRTKSSRHPEIWRELNLSTFCCNWYIKLQFSFKFWQFWPKRVHSSPHCELWWVHFRHLRLLWNQITLPLRRPDLSITRIY